MADFEAYFDESGRHNAANLVVAGYVATVFQWKKLSNAWSRALSDWSVDAFHMTDAEARQKVFKPWTALERDERIARLGEIVRKHVTCSVTVSLDRRAYIKASQKPLPRFQEKKLVQDPYPFLCHLAVHRLRDVCRLHAIAPSSIRPIFAKTDRKGLDEAARAGGTARALALGFRAPTWEEPRERPALQAADVMAWLGSHIQSSSDTAWLRERHRGFLGFGMEPQHLGEEKIFEFFKLFESTSNAGSTAENAEER